MICSSRSRNKSYWLVVLVVLPVLWGIVPSLSGGQDPHMDERQLDTSHDHPAADGDSHAEHLAADGECHAEHPAADAGSHAEHLAADEECHAEHLTEDGDSHAEHLDEDLEHDEDHSHHNGESASPESVETGHEHEHEEEGVLELTADQRAEIHLAIEKAGPGDLVNENTFPGEVVLNEDQVVHIVPRVAGIIVKVCRTLGDRVGAGEALAVVDSIELGEGKVEYFECHYQLEILTVDLQRARAIAKNVQHLLDILKKDPSLEDIEHQTVGEMGGYRARLLSSYAELSLARKTYERKKVLIEDKIVSESSFLEAQNGFEKARAHLLSEMDSIGFDVQRDLVEKQRERNIARLKLWAAEQKLRLWGVSENEFEELRTLSLDNWESDGGSSEETTDCVSNPLSRESAGDGKSNFSQTAIKAPFDGTLIERHVTRGEKVGTESHLFTLATLNKIWVKMKVPNEHIVNIHPGQEISLNGPNGMESHGLVDRISPLMDEKTRVTEVRILLNNSDGLWRPGMFVSGYVPVETSNVPLVVSKEAVQMIDGENVVFLALDHGFKAVPVRVGRSSREYVEILSGLTKGTDIVAKGAFELKSVLITSSMDAHAGHGH